MRIIVGNGKVAQILRRPYDVVLSHSDIELRDDVDDIARSLYKAERAGAYISPETVVINTAAKINLEWCEKNTEECYSINVHGAHKLALACDILGMKLVHISSGCVFDGMETGRVYTEEDTPTPACFYASSKAIADDMLMSTKLEQAPLIVRPRQLVSARPNPTNMLTKFLSLPDSARFIDVPNSLTCIEDFADMVDHLIGIRASGIYNCVNAGTMSPLEIARSLAPLRSGWDPQPIAYTEYLKLIEVKRVNALLSTAKLEATGYVPRDARAAVGWCVENYGREA